MLYIFLIYCYHQTLAPPAPRVRLQEAKVLYFLPSTYTMLGMCLRKTFLEWINEWINKWLLLKGKTSLLRTEGWSDGPEMGGNLVQAEEQHMWRPWGQNQTCQLQQKKQGQGLGAMAGAMGWSPAWEAARVTKQSPLAKSKEFRSDSILFKNTKPSPCFKSFQPHINHELGGLIILLNRRGKWAPKRLGH